MISLLLAGALSLSPAPLRAQTAGFDGLFGITPGDALHLFQQQQRQEAERKERQRGWDVFWGRVVSPRHPENCVFTAVARRMKVTINPRLERPTVYYESRSELSDFQSAVHWENGQTLDRMTNIYLPRLNVVYLVDKSDLYRRGRTIDDSLAHLYVYYFQYHYQGLKDDFKLNSEHLQATAVQVQNWFRSTYMAAGKSPCAAR
mgnify:CR=1 FL=1